MRYNFSRYWIIPYLVVLVISCVIGIFFGWFYYDDAILGYFFVFTMISVCYVVKFVKDKVAKVCSILFSVLGLFILYLYLFYCDFFSNSVFFLIFLVPFIGLFVYLGIVCLGDNNPFLENSVAMSGALIIAMIIVVNIGSLSPFRVTSLSGDKYFDSKVITVSRNNVILEKNYVLVKNDGKVAKFYFKHVNKGDDKVAFADKIHKSGTKELNLEVRTFSLKKLMADKKNKVSLSQLKRFLALSRLKSKLQGKPFVYEITDIKYQ